MSSPAPSPAPRAASFLEQVLLWNLLIHLAAMASMALALMPGLPGGAVDDPAARAASVAEHPWLWRLGWVPWHASAFIDLLTGLALVCTRWVPRLPALLTVLVTAAAVIPEQLGEVSWVTQGVGLAQEAVRSGDLQPYLAFEAWAYRLTVAVGASLYILMALGWTWCFAASGTWNRALTFLSPLTWGSLAVGSVGQLLPEGFRAGPSVVNVTNGIGFLLLEVWLWLVAEEVLRRSRSPAAHGRQAPWHHPWRGPIGWVLDAVASSRVLRAFGEWLPPVAFRSDITDVIYCNYLIDADTTSRYVPPGLELERLGPGGKYALFTFLTYHHGHFGPAFLGPLRRLLPSPVHSNWRLYVGDPRTRVKGIYFVSNAITATLPALAARHLSEGMPMHVPARAAVEARPDGSFYLLIDPGAGTSPDAEGVLRPAEPVLPGSPWTDCFASYRDFLAYCVPQDRALSVQPWYARVVRQEIALGIPLEVCQPLTGEVRSRAAAALAGEGQAVCFRVPAVSFYFEREQYDPLPGA